MLGQWGRTLVTWLSLQIILILGDESGWRPLKSSKPDFIIGPRFTYHTRKPAISNFHQPCSLYKAVMNQRIFRQYVQYKHHIPDLKEFTLCSWYKLYNHSSDHPIFAYSTPHKKRAILSCIMNSPNKSFYVLAINDHTIYRINYPIKLHKWYHTCQSWNGKTGEWQLWVNGERVGRGYYNLMVGKIIKSGGVAISGQKNIDYDGRFLWRGKEDGLQGEITLLQLYKAALSKGKAYSDHKHHHVHEWGLDGEPMDNNGTDDSTTEPPPPETTTPEHPFLENGQLKHRLPVHELLARGTTPKPMHNLELLAAFERFRPSALLNFDEPSSSLENTFDHNFGVFKRHNADQESSSRTISPPPLPSPSSMETEQRIHRVIKRFANATRRDRRRFIKPHIVRSPYDDDDDYSTHRVIRRYLRDKYKRNKVNSVDTKRAFILSEHLPSSMEFVPEMGLPNLYSELDGHDILVDDPFFKNTIPDSGRTKIEYEPAEWEVRKIFDVCSACDDDPFKKANVLSWQETPKKLYAGAEYVPAIPKCHIF